MILQYSTILQHTQPFIPLFSSLSLIHPYRNREELYCLTVKAEVCSCITIRVIVQDLSSGNDSSSNLTTYKFADLNGVTVLSSKIPKRFYSLLKKPSSANKRQSYKKRQNRTTGFPPKPQREVPVKKVRESSASQVVSPRHFPSEKARFEYFTKLIEHNQNSQAMFSISTVSHITADTRHPLVMLTSREGYKYLFGKVPEGTQRVLNENKFKVAKLKSLFLTGTLTTWSDIGGLPGLFLTLSDSSKKGIDVFTNSAKILSYIVASWRTFVFRKGAELKLIDTKEDEIIGDNNLAIRAIKIKSSTDLVEVSETKSKSLFIQMQKLVSLMFPTDTSKVNDPDPDSYKSDPTETDIHTHAKLPEPQELLPSRLQESVCYIIRFLPIRGKFDPVKAKALGLQPGLNYRKLSQGISVENDKGDIITPEQVIEPPKVFPKVLILDIPNSSYLENSLNSDKWFLSDPDMGEEDIGLVYHFLGKDIDFENEKYLKFISKFPENSKHVISHPKLANNTLVFKRSAINILTLKCIFKDNFNLPNIESYEPLPEGSIYKLHHLQQFHINSSGVVSDDSLIQNDTWKSLYDEFIASLNIPGADINEIVKSEPATLDPLPVSLKEQVHIVTLGTGSALPSLHRNVISTLVRIPYRNAAGDIKFNSIMLDGGENTLGTMLRNFGHNFGQQVQQVFKELAMIHLSHLHADHHLGLISVINKWFDVNHEDKSRKLFLVIPWQYETFVTEWYKHEGQLNDSFESNRIVFISCEDFMQDRLPKYEKVHLSEFERLYDSKELNQAVPKEPLAPLNRSAINDLFHTLGISTLQTVRALHCSWAYSISITFDLDDGETFKVSYSGDTRPNPKFVEIGRNSDLLIHESSLDNELIEEAVAKKHSTMIEAINVARYMNCPKLILTHFSTRYSNKTNTAGDNEDLVQLSESLDNYLRQYRVSPNIFSLEYQRHPTKSFDELDICYAYDFMNYRYKDIHLQKAKLGLVYSSFAAEEEDLEKKERDLAKQREKQEVKRSQRLITKSNSIKKRRVSSEEDSM